MLQTLLNFPDPTTWSGTGKLHQKGPILYDALSHSPLGGWWHRHAHTQYTNTHIHHITQTHTKQSKGKAYGSHAEHSYCRPVNQHWDACTSLRCLSLVQANLPGAGLVTCRWTVQVSWREVTEHFVMVPTPLSETRTVGNLLPEVPIDVTVR